MGLTHRLKRLGDLANGRPGPWLPLLDALHLFVDAVLAGRHQHAGGIKEERRAVHVISATHGREPGLGLVHLGRRRLGTRLVGARPDLAGGGRGNEGLGLVDSSSTPRQ